MLDDGRIYIYFQLQGDQIFRVGLFEIAHVWCFMEEGQIVHNGVKIKVIVVSIAGNFVSSHVPTRIAAEDQDKLSFVFVFVQIAHYFFWRDIHLPDIFCWKTICSANVWEYTIHVWLFFALVDDSESEAIVSVAFGDGLEGVGSGVGVLPGEIASGPHLQHQDDEHDDDGAEVDESIFFAMGLEDEIVLN